MTFKKALASSAILFVTMFLLGMGGGAYISSLPTHAHSVDLAQTPQPPATETPQLSPEDQAIRAAFEAKVNANNNLIIGLQIYDVFIDYIQYSADGKSALIWMALRDRETGQVVESEPGLSVASVTPQASPDQSSSWTILMQSEAAFESSLRSLPADLLTDEIRQRFLEGSPAPLLNSAVPLAGYKLPWTAGVSKRMTNSIGHVYTVSGGLTSCPTTCRYAFDFADGTMFPILAAKGGTIKAYKTTCPNFGTDCTNYLVLEDQSTVPTTYQLYYHMAYNSIPARLRQLGTQVQQGEYLGDADDTGMSTGHHLHFHVYTTPTGSNWSWGPSIDITFDDVKDNGGRPRTCAEAKEYPDMGAQCTATYTSGNTPAHPPSGTLDAPLTQQTINSATVRVQGTASDDLQISRIQVLANYDGSWKTIDDIPPTGNGPYAKDVNLCSAGVPDGPFALTVNIYDREGSLAPGIVARQLIKNYNCAGQAQPPLPPACVPNADQVALFADTDYQGACTVFNVNATAGYPVGQLGAVGDNNAASVRVGGNVRAVLYDRSSDIPQSRPSGRLETFESNDAGLADNRIGVDQVSGLWVLPRSKAPSQPYLNPVGNNLKGNSPTSLDSLVLSWEGGAGATAFDVSLTGPSSKGDTVTGTSYSVGSLAAGSYTWQVTARNSAGSAATSATFTVSAASFASASTRAVPYEEHFTSGADEWTGTGLWRVASIDIGNHASQAWIFNNGNSYNDANWRAGDLTSPPISLPAGSSYLRFLYYMDTEDGFTNWDQRRVQVSANGGPFTDLYLQSDDKQSIGQIWFNSGVINLSSYAGKTIRLRFHFDTVDEDRNEGKGWMIDDVTISSQGPNTACADNNNTPATAQTLLVGVTVSAMICPEGDLDYYKINVTAGQPLVADIDARTLNPASKLDSYLQLYEADGHSPVAENDDEVYLSKVDSLLSYTFQRSGVYYLRVKAWNHPGMGSTDHFYNLTLRQTIPMPPNAVQIVYPKSGLTPVSNFPITATATDFDGGPVAAVDFYWHSGDWNTAWVKLGSDTNGVDGWALDANPSLYGSVPGSAVYVQAISRTGGVRGTALWNLQPDLSVPITQLAPLPAQTNSTAVKLSWTASEPQSDINYFEIQVKVNNTGGWLTSTEMQHISGSLRSFWFLGDPGKNYQFRLRAVDKAGNQEAFTEMPQASTSLAAGCMPDANEKGQTVDTALALTSGQMSPIFNLCKSAQTGSGDMDWLKLNVQSGGKDQLLWVLPRGGGAAFTASLYNASNQLVKSWQSADFGSWIGARWTPPANGTYYLKIESFSTALFGTGVTYQVVAGDGNWIYLPEINR